MYPPIVHDIKQAFLEVASSCIMTGEAIGLTRTA